MRLVGSQFFASSFITLLVLMTPVAWGQVRSSSQYQMMRDSLNTGGGFSSSTGYALEDTIGDTATGRGTSTNFILDAGYQQQPLATLSLAGGAPVVMDTSLGGVSGGVSNGSTFVIASTDDPVGYQLTVQASSEPAMQSASNTIADYTPAGGTADVTFTTEATDAHFGFSPFGDDIVDRYKTNGVACGLGGASSTACWDGLSTSTITIASAAGATVPDGATTTVHFRVGVGGEVAQAPGTYTATATITLLPL